MRQAHDPHGENFVAQSSPAWQASVRQAVAAELAAEREALAALVATRLAPLIARVVAEQLSAALPTKTARKKNLLPFTERTIA